MDARIVGAVEVWWRFEIKKVCGFQMRSLIPSVLLPGHHVPGQVAPLSWNRSMAVGFE